MCNQNRRGTNLPSWRFCGKLCRLTRDGVDVRNANDIAEWFVRYSADELGAPVDPMSLEKLIYYAQAFHLMLKDQPLFRDEIQAWRLGPVIPSIHEKYPGYGSVPIVLSVEDAVASSGSEIETFLSEVVGFFCRHTAINLSRATHLENPWIDASEARDNTISQASLKAFYRALTEDGEKALSRCELLDSAPEPRWSSFYVAGICWRKMTRHPFYDGVLAKQLARTGTEDKPVFPESFYSPVKGRDFVEFTDDEDVDETIRRVVS
jgi:uncharacterized phage-associated protein